MPPTVGSNADETLDWRAVTHLRRATQDGRVLKLDANEIERPVL